VCYLRDGDRVFETYWSSGSAAEALPPAHGLLEGELTRSLNGTFCGPRRMIA
jgi:hypothetical protein